MTCPNCSAAMEHMELAGVYGPGIEVDLCFACHVLWLDKRESLQLSPRGTLDLFRSLHEHRGDPRHALEGGNRCPRCERRLSLSQDIGRAGRFSYYSCPAGDGRLTPFSEFLKEKEFVRSLTVAEQEQLKAEIKTVECSGCGAPVDLNGGFQCGHCGSPITVLDPDAVARTLRELEAADQRATSGDAADREHRARALSMMETMRTRHDDPYQMRSGFSFSVRGTGGDSPVADLLVASIGFLFRDL